MASTVGRRMLDDIQQIHIPRATLDKTFEFLRSYGKQRKEAHALWTGREAEDRTFLIHDVLFPKQHNTAVTYVVPEDEIHRINVSLNAQGLVAIAQIHTHPGEAFHSGIDDDGSSLLSLSGSLSIVIPDYGFVKEDSDTTDWAVYRYNSSDDRWEEVVPEVKRTLFRII